VNESLMRGQLMKTLLMLTAVIALASAAAVDARTQTHWLRKLVQSGDNVVGTP
jgi:hypothetical protein